MLYSCTHIATVGVKGLNFEAFAKIHILLVIQFPCFSLLVGADMNVAMGGLQW